MNREHKNRDYDGFLIGLDFDNTLVSYDRLFYALAREQNVIPEQIAAQKNAVRDYLRAQDREDEWTALQGQAYGPRILEAQPFDGMLDCLQHWEAQGHALAIVSHKTRHPYAGPPYDLHAAAHSWIERHLRPAGLQLRGGIYLEESRHAKLERILKLDPKVYIDDLPDLLADLHRLSRERQQCIQGLLFATYLTPPDLKPPEQTLPAASESSESLSAANEPLYTVYHAWAKLQELF